MSDYEYADQISVQGLTFQDADLAEEEADSEDSHEALPGSPELRLVRTNAARTVPEIGLTDALGQDAMQNILEACYNRIQTQRLVSLHYGHGGLAAGGRKRV